MAGGMTFKVFPARVIDNWERACSSSDSVTVTPSFVSETGPLARSLTDSASMAHSKRNGSG